MIARRIRVYGLVQGVGFRHYTCREAHRLGLNGWVRNRLDGSVEIHAQGNREAVEALSAWAKTGPMLARVDRAESSNCQVEYLDGFTEQETV